MKDIGSIFPLYNNDYEDVCFKRRFPTYNHFALCREASLYIVQKTKVSKKCVLLPAYTCQTVIDPFQQEGWECVYYPVQKNMRIDINAFLKLREKYKPSMVVAHPYYGMLWNDEECQLLKDCYNSEIFVLADLTQCIWSDVRYDFVSAYVGSWRKWLEVPDGAFLEDNGKTIENDLPEFEDFLQFQSDAMYLRGCYFENCDQRTKDISIRLNKVAVSFASKEIMMHKMSEFSERILANANLNEQEQRIVNYKILYEDIEDSDKLTRVVKNIDDVNTPPLYFPLYVKDRKSLQKYLAERHVYCPILWGVETSEVLVNETVEYIYANILVVPIDQRYNEQDMNNIVKWIKEWKEKEK